jgi:ion channel POLLUX/CASTOR
MTQKPSNKQKLQYWFDNQMAKGVLAQIALLFLLSLVIIIVVSLFVWIIRAVPDKNFIEIAWMGLMRTLDAGTMGGDEGSWIYLLSMFVITLGGVFIVSTLIGVLGAGVEGKLEELRKGRSLVLENDHTVILGWSPQIFTIISELIIANENKKNQAIAILAEKDKMEMDEEISGRIEDTKTTHVVSRFGSPIDLNDLDIVRPQASRSVIILPEGDMPDASVVKSVLALTNDPDRRPEPYHIITQVRQPATLDVLRMISGRDKVQAIMISDLLARIVAQTSRQSGLSIVYTELLNFGGDEIYFKDEPALAGKTFGESLSAYETSSVMGIRFADGTIKLNPPMDIRLGKGDQVIAISEDDDTIRISAQPGVPLSPEAITTSHTTPQLLPEKGLILGWNLWAATIVHNLDSYVVKGSQITVVSNAEDEDSVTENCAGLENLSVVFREGDLTDRRLLDNLNIAEYEHIIVLADTRLDIQHADANTMITLLHLGDIAEKQNKHFSVVSEMLDLRNRQLAEITHADDFIVSDHLISLMIAQLSENGELFDVFTDLFDPEGSEIYLKPVGDYVTPGKPVNLYTVLESARRKGEVLLGYRIAAEEDAENHGVYTNPKKSTVITFTENDKVVVLAEN